MEPTKEQKQWAKDLSIEVYEYIVKHKLKDKFKLPIGIKRKILNLYAMCPLCVIFVKDTGEKDCKRCPIGIDDFPCYKPQSLWNKWMSGRNDAAKKILKIVKGWKI